ncbi:DNA topoisomerase-1 [Halarchaeum solikamskense]|uniref:endonuclease NucS domain-containing protein n=1 Tax=Halarchaeum nitratireducens TaxID=489913 RepID=UPI001B3B1832|nr:endonuclease NucS domain-containing protein [Halarchaeum solikamskense]MBP2250206.1 DNA topoisomerase-1 [Halarchaeum solikamskense]
MQDATRVLAGDCTVSYEDAERTEKRGEVIVLVKPDNTVLVHDSDGYQPASWLTRADVVRYASDADGARIVAGSGTERLDVRSHETTLDTFAPVTPAGPEVGTCPDCDGPLVRARGDVVCVGCRARYPVPRDATVLDETCARCGLPRIRVERGAVFEVCLDRHCEPIDAAVRERFDGAWNCPACGGALRIERRNALRARCAACENAYAVPSGTVVGECDCGGPRFETPSGERCLATACPARAP